MEVTTATAAPSKSAPVSTNKILLIEDNPGDARLVEIFLFESDFRDCEVVNKTTLESALDALESGEEFAVILLDLTLPDSRGFETLERLISRFPHSNVIVMTGLADKSLGVRAVKAGAQDFLVKGAFDADSLAKSLRFSIERSKVLKRLEEAQRLAHIGTWEFFPGSNFFTGSEELYRILDCQQCYRSQNALPAHCNFEILNEIHRVVAKEGIFKKDLEIRQKDGAQRFVSIQCSATQSVDGEALFQGVIQDITEKRKADELRKEKEVAEQSAKMKEQFVASISHEMRTPMNAILGMSNLLLQSGLGDEQLNLVHSIKHSSEILLGVVNDILEISSIQNGKIVFENQPFDLQELLSNLLNVMQYKTQEKDLYLQIIVEEGVPDFISGDKLRLNQVLYNLVGNAIKFTDRGYVKIFVNKLLETDSSVQLKFIVEDTGIGIPENKIEAVFETFTRILQKDRIYEGTGLGLSICKNLIEQQGGKIGAFSELGKGSKFFFDLVFNKTNSLNGAPKTMVATRYDLDEGTTFSLLLVEDHKMNQMVARKTLERKWQNIQLTVAENGQNAIDLLREQDFDIVLMDIQMPVLDGFEATKYIRENMPEKAGLPILAMTAHAQITKDEKFKETGMDDYVLKPFEPEDLFSKIAKYVKRT